MLLERRTPVTRTILTRLAALATAAVLATGLVASAASGSAAKPAASKQNLVETAVAAGQFETLASLLGKAGLADTLANGGPYTVFAPTDAAFAKVPKKTLAALGRNPERLKAVLLYHVASGKLRANRVVKRRSIETLNGASVRIKVRKRTVKVNNARVVKANIGASNGVIHVINRVLLPPKG
jgi:uncharacterized surface protein with fasciclin (FAS1) repeats